MSQLYCNPMEIAYKYQHPLFGKYAYKEAADPTILFFKGKYYLFTSKCGGFYYSDDLFHWEFHEDRSLEIHGYAPDISEHDGYLYFCASSLCKKCKILRAKNPLDGFETVSAPFAFWDPHLHFEREKAYLYWGCSSRHPIYGIEMNPRTMLPVGKKVAIVAADPKAHGIDNKEIYLTQKDRLRQKCLNLFVGTGAFIEGAFLNQIGARYYFQYATPGTEFPTYGDAVLVGGSPLGPFVWQKHNPFSVVPSGFLQGAGHGSTFYDKYGNLWHAASVCVGVNHNFERRLGLWPAGVDRDGLLFCNQYFADYPKRIPDGAFDPWSIEPEWMLLSYRKKADASTFCAGFPPAHALDESIKTMWRARSGESGEWLCVDLGKIYDVRAVQVHFGDWQTPKKKAPLREYGGTFTQERYIEEELVTYAYRLEYSRDGESWLPFGPAQETLLPHHLIEDAADARYLRVTLLRAPYGQNFALSGLRVFGRGNGALPPPAAGIAAKRLDAVTGVIRWEAPTGVHACIRLGIAPDKLYHSILLYDQREYAIPFLNRETETYFFAVDTFSENGVTKGEIHSF